MTDWWQEKSLEELSRAEWEALCDGCAKCCLHKLQDQDSGNVYYTGVRCRLLNEKTCRCSDYPNRLSRVSNCIDLVAAARKNFEWLPSTCAYRLRSNNQPLPQWHPLVSGSSDSVHLSGMSVLGRTISEEYVHPDGYDEHIVHWVD